MSNLTLITAMKSPRKAKFGFKAPLRESNLFPLVSWLRDNLPDPAGCPADWWFTLASDQINIYTDDPLIASVLQAQAAKEPV